MKPGSVVLTLIAFAILAGCTADNADQAVDTARPVDSAADTAANVVSLTCNERSITGNGIGLLRIGASVDSVKNACAVLRDTTFRGGEGQPTRTLLVGMGSDTVIAEVASGKIFRIQVKDAAFQTSDSLAVGSSLEQLLKLDDLHPMVGEGRVFVASASHCGISFELPVSVSAAPHGDWTTSALRSLPAQTKVSRVLLVGCDTQRQ